MLLTASVAVVTFKTGEFVGGAKKEKDFDMKPLWKTLAQPLPKRKYKHMKPAWD